MACKLSLNQAIMKNLLDNVCMCNNTSVRVTEEGRLVNSSGFCAGGRGKDAVCREEEDQSGLVSLKLTLTCCMFERQLNFCYTE